MAARWVGGDALDSINGALGYKLRWLMRTVMRLGIGALFLRSLLAASQQPRAIGASHGTQEPLITTRVGDGLSSGIVKKPVLGRLA